MIVKKLKLLLKAYKAYYSRRDKIGKSGEQAMLAFFTSDPNFTVVTPKRWGIIDQVGETALPSKADGLAIANALLPHPASCCLLEVKNRREWLYTLDVEYWTHIFNCLNAGITGIYFCRRASHSAITQVAWRLGIFVVETRAQFIYPRLKKALQGSRNRDVLGFHDQQFTLEWPKHLAKHVIGLTRHFEKYHSRVQAVRESVISYAEMLSQTGHSVEERQRIYAELLLTLDKLFPEDVEQRNNISIPEYSESMSLTAQSIITTMRLSETENMSVVKCF